jgi:hypothetical protein
MFSNQKLTSDQWFNYLNGINKYHVIIMEHAGGWNAHNLHYEWYEEKIDRAEFDRRLAGSVKRSERKSDLKKKGITNYEYHV